MPPRWRSGSTPVGPNHPARLTEWAAKPSSVSSAESNAPWQAPCSIPLAASFRHAGALLGFATHSVNRAGWFGPTGVDADRQRGGIGGPLLAACLEDLQVAGFDRCEISWIGPVGFYAKAAGAVVSRVFQLVGKAKP